MSGSATGLMDGRRRSVIALVAGGADRPRLTTHCNRRGAVREEVASRHDLGALPEAPHDIGRLGWMLGIE